MVVQVNERYNFAKQVDVAFRSAVMATVFGPATDG